MSYAFNPFTGTLDLAPDPPLEEVQRVAFDYSTPSPMILGSIAAGALVTFATILVLEAFDGAGASLQLGTSATPGGILAPSQVAPAIIGEYSAPTLVPFVVSDLLLLTISPAGSAHGRGLLLYRVKS